MQDKADLLHESVDTGLWFWVTFLGKLEDPDNIEILKLSLGHKILAWRFWRSDDIFESFVRRSRPPWHDS